MCSILSTWNIRDGGNRKLKIIDIDLSKRDIQVTDDEKLDKYLGGVILATEIFTKNCSPTIDPLSKENVIVIANGPLTAAFPTASKAVAMFKSPLNNELGESYAGGRMASALRSSQERSLDYSDRTVRARQRPSTCCAPTPSRRRGRSSSPVTVSPPSRKRSNGPSAWCPRTSLSTLT